MPQDNIREKQRNNPFFESYNTPHDTVPFDRIRLEDYEEAFMEGIRRDDEATDKIVNDPELLPSRTPLQGWTQRRETITMTC